MSEEELKEAIESSLAWGKVIERERIIALLETEINSKVWDAQMLTIAWCVALIKGENK